MALATQCPYCHTTFRVAHDQLKLRAGLVRCGACKQIFNGIENLLRPEQLEATATGLAAPPPPVEPTPEATQSTHPEPTAPGSGPEAPETSDAPAPTQIDTGPAEHADDPLLRMTLMDFAHEAQRPTADPGAEQAENADSDESAEAAAPEPSEPRADPLAQAIDDLENKPWRQAASEAGTDGDALDMADDAAYEEPGFVRQGRRRQRFARAARIAMAIGLPLLSLALLGQAAYAWRDQLAARFPQTKPVLAAACAQIGCKLALPAQIDAVAIESSELQSLAPERNLFALSALLRNRSDIVQAWPSIELTLNDANEKPVARRVLAPRDYLSTSQDVDQGFAPTSEQAVKLAFELSQLQASGYRVYLFYP